MEKEKATTVGTQMESQLTKLTREEMFNMFHLLAAHLGFHVITEPESVPPPDKGTTEREHKTADGNGHATPPSSTASPGEEQVLEALEANRSETEAALCLLAAPATRSQNVMEEDESEGLTYTSDLSLKNRYDVLRETPEVGSRGGADSSPKNAPPTAAPHKRRREELERARTSDSEGESSSHPTTPLAQRGGRSVAVKTPKKMKGTGAEGTQPSPLGPRSTSGQRQEPSLCTATETTHEIAEDNMLCDTHDFKLVSHKKKRKNIPVVIRPTDGGDLRIANPIEQHEQLLNTTGEQYTKRRFSATGSLTIEVPNEEAVKRLLSVTELGGVSVTATVPLQYMSNAALIKGVDTWHTEESLIEYLRDQGVQRVRRRMRRVGHGPENLRPSKEVVVYFADNAERPERLSLGYVKHKLWDHVDTPPRCYNCQRFGHLASFCRKKTPTCGICAGEHRWSECQAGAQPKCANCAKAHPANDNNCEARRSAIQRARVFAYGKAPGKKAKDQEQTTVTRSTKETAMNRASRVTFRDAVLGVNTLPGPPQDRTLPQLEQQQQQELQRLQQQHAAQKEKLLQLQRNKALQRTPNAAEASNQWQERVMVLEATLALFTNTLTALAGDLPPGDKQAAIKTLITIGQSQAASRDETTPKEHHG